jgi:Fic family protein
MYDSPHQFEPLIPSDIPPSLMRRASDISLQSAQLSGAVHPTTAEAVRKLLRKINAYYSNRIEQEEVEMEDIEAALAGDFSSRRDIAKRQRIAVGHIEAERELERRVAQGATPLASEFLLGAHRALYSTLLDEDRTLEDWRVLVPGEIRREDVEVGRHVPPTHASLIRFLARMDEVYGAWRGWDQQLILIACAHQRAAWVHPFTDGNGRAIRLQTHAALWPLSGGVWSISRGLALTKDEYFARLDNADHPRQGNYDGRGNLTNKGLLQWVEFFLDVCAGQIQYMSRMLDPDGMKHRIESLVESRARDDDRYRESIILPLHYAYATGPVSRRHFSQMTCLGEREAKATIALLLEDGLLESESHVGPLRFSIPSGAIGTLLPKL